MNDILRIARLRIALQRAFLGRAILRVTEVGPLRISKSKAEVPSHFEPIFAE